MSDRKTVEKGCDEVKPFIGVSAERELFQTGYLIEIGG
jgi:hypothetical protein